jgi:peptidoglycan L-alanyl-D-glutamate endopeptidase CwlK
LVRVVKRAITMTTVDFKVTCGLRTKEQQYELVKAGASQTMKSRHLTGHAVDLGALVEGKIRWDWPLYHLIADAMKQAATFEHVGVEWGGCWDSLLAITSPENGVTAYVAACKANGKRAFMDGPHYQLPWGAYPA